MDHQNWSKNERNQLEVLLGNLVVSLPQQPNPHPIAKTTMNFWNDYIPTSEWVKAAESIGGERVPCSLGGGADDSNSTSLMNWIDRGSSNTHAVNLSFKTSFRGFIRGDNEIKSGEFGCEMILSYYFKREVQIHGFAIYGDQHDSPKKISVFLDFYKALDTRNASRELPDDEFLLRDTEVMEGRQVFLKMPLQKKKIRICQMYIQTNQNNHRTTSLQWLNFFGVGDP